MLYKSIRVAHVRVSHVTSREFPVLTKAIYTIPEQSQIPKKSGKWSSGKTLGLHAGCRVLSSASTAESIVGPAEHGAPFPLGSAMVSGSHPQGRGFDSRLLQHFFGCS